MLHTKTLTEKIVIAPVVKVIGNKQYVVESFFNENANLDLTDKVKKLIENDVKRRTNTLCEGYFQEDSGSGAEQIFQG